MLEVKTVNFVSLCDVLFILLQIGVTVELSIVISSAKVVLIFEAT